MVREGVGRRQQAELVEEDRHRAAVAGPAQGHDARVQRAQRVAELAHPLVIPAGVPAPGGADRGQQALDARRVAQHCQHLGIGELVVFGRRRGRLVSAGAGPPPAGRTTPLPPHAAGATPAPLRPPFPPARDTNPVGRAPPGQDCRSRPGACSLPQIDVPHQSAGLGGHRGRLARGVAEILHVGLHADQRQGVADCVLSPSPVTSTPRPWGIMQR